MFIGAHEAEYMFVTTLLKIEQHLLAQGRCPYKLFRLVEMSENKTLTMRTISFFMTESIDCLVADRYARLRRVRIGTISKKNEILVL